MSNEVFYEISIGKKIYYYKDLENAVKAFKMFVSEGKSNIKLETNKFDDNEIKDLEMFYE